jgi:uncharacterized membrane protein
MQRSAALTFIGNLTKYLVPLAALLVFTGWLLVTPPGILGKADAVGCAVCHRIEARSFHIGERQFPLCARCSGTFMGVVTALLYQTAVGRRRTGTPPWKVIVPFILLIVAFAIDGSNSYLYLIKETYPGAFSRIPNLYIPQNWLRLLTGSGMGLGLAATIYPVFNQTVWRKVDPRPALSNLWHLVILLGIMLLVDLGIMTGSPIILYPVALISTVGVLVPLTMIYTIIWILIMQQENIFETLHQLWLPITAGFTLTLIMVLTIDLLRFRLTGTWGGFPLGLK